MAVFRLLIVGILLTRARSAGDAAPLEAPYEPFTLSCRPLPATLTIYPHPREISPERVYEITGGRIA